MITASIALQPEMLAHAFERGVEELLVEQAAIHHQRASARRRGSGRSWPEVRPLELEQVRRHLPRRSSTTVGVRNLVLVRGESAAFDVVTAQVELFELRAASRAYSASCRAGLAHERSVRGQQEGGLQLRQAGHRLAQAPGCPRAKP